MNKNLSEVVFIIDRSGSMSGLEADTIGGFNSMINKQRKEEGQVLISTVLFDDKVEILHDRLDLNKIETMNDNQYYVRGCTALLDALGYTIHHIENIHKYARDEDRPSKTLFIITTDGYENASQKYNYEEIKTMIERQKEKCNWEFLFLGANIDAIDVASRFGIASSRAVNYCSDSKGTELNYEVLNETVSKIRKCSDAKEMQDMFDEDDCLADIRENYENRG